MEAEEEIRGLGAEVVVIGNGAVEFLEDFASPYSESMVFLTDPDKRAYEALSLQRGLGGFRILGLMGAGLRAYRKGHRQGKTRGDPLQLGGVFVVAPGGEVLFEHRSRSAGDHPEMAAILGALQSRPEAGLS